MDKLKSILSPGQSKDDEILYGNSTYKSDPSAHGFSQKEKLAGEGSHFGSKQDETAAATAGTSSIGDNKTQTSPVTARDTTSGNQPLQQRLNPTVASTSAADDASTASIKSGVPGSTTQRQPILTEQSGYQEKNTPIAQSQEPVHETSEEHEKKGVFGLLGKLDPRNKNKEDDAIAAEKPATTKHHDNKDYVAPAAAGTAAAAASHHHRDEPKSEQALTRENQQSGIVGGSAVDRSAPAATRQPASSSTYNNTPTDAPGSTTTPATQDTTRSHQSDHHYARDGAAAGGLGAAGAGAYYAHEHNKNQHQTETANRLDPNADSTQIPHRELPTGAVTGDNKHHSESSASQSTGSTGVPGSAAVAAASAAWNSKEKDSHPTMPGRFPSETGDNPYAASTLDPRVDAHPGVSQSGAPTSTSAPLSQQQQQPASKDHHYGRDAGIAAGAAGLGAAGYESTRDRDNKTKESATAPTSSTTQQSTTAPASSQTYAQQPAQKDHHYGRDAGLAAGAAGLGAAGYGATRDHENKNKEAAIAPTSSTAHQSTVPPTTSQSYAQQPEHKDHHYGRDAGLATGAAGLGAAGYRATRDHDNKNKEAAIAPTSSAAHQSTAAPASSQSYPQQPQQKDHHYGRDAGLATGAAGLGAARCEATRDHDHKAKEATSAPTSSTTQKSTLTPVTSETYNDTAFDSSQQPEQKKDHHYGRDAGLAAGAAGLGAAGYEATRDRDNKDKKAAIAPTSSTAHKSSVTPVTSENYADTAFGNSQQPEQKKDHHYGRDAGLAGAGGLAAYELSKDHEKQQEPTSATPAQRNVASGPTSTSSPSSKYSSVPTYTGPRGTAVEEPTQTDPNSHVQTTDSTKEPSKDHHYGRDAALGAGAAGVGYEALQHRPKHEYAAHDPFPTNPDVLVSQRGGPTTTNEQRYDPSQSTTHQGFTGIPHTTTATQDPALKEQHKDHHYGRDAGIAGAGVGAAGLGAYELNKNHDGKDKTAPATSSSGYPTTATQPTTSSSYPTSTDRTIQGQVPEQKDHHYGRDAALVGAGGAAAGGLYEADKHHDRNHPATSTSQHEATPLTQDREQKKRDSEDHTGRNAALAGAGVGAAALGAHELSEHDKENLEKERLKHEKEAAKQHDKEVKAEEKAAKKEQKAHDKAVAKEEKQAEKEHKKEEKQHEKELAAAAAAAEAAHKKEEHDRAKEAERQRQEEEKRVEKEKKHHEKEVAAAAAAAEAEHKREEHQRQKEAEKQRAEQEKERKEHEKELAAAAAVAEAARVKHEKAAAQEQQAAREQEQKEAEKRKAEEEHHHKEEAAAAAVAGGAGAAAYAHHKHNEEEEATAAESSDNEEKREKKKHHFFGFLHRNKDKDSKDKDDAASASSADDKSDSHKKGLSAAALGGGAAAAYEHDHSKDRNRLHKDPPESVSQHRATEGQTIPGATTGTGASNSHALDPTTTSHAHPGDGHSSNIVTEPITGLKMDLSKDPERHGAGGTDGSTNIQGYHS